MYSYSGQGDGRVGLYVAAETLTPAKNYFEVEIIESGVVGAIGQCPRQDVAVYNNSINSQKKTALTRVQRPTTAMFL